MHRDDGNSAARLRRPFLAVCVFAGFGAVAWQLISIGSLPPEMIRLAASEVETRHATARPDIVDRNGHTLATDIRVYWVHADPKDIINADETYEQLGAVISGLDPDLRARLRSPARFVWVKRGLTPKEAASVHKLGLPGIHITEEPQRVYPAGEAVAHIVGQTNVDNVGMFGAEKVIDTLSLGGDAKKPVRLTLDLRVQYALRAELETAKAHYQAEAAGAILLDVNTGDVLALASLPDYDPNRRGNALGKERRNRLMADTYELGSVFKAFTIATAIDTTGIAPQDEFDIATPLRVNRFTVRDKYARTQYASVEQILAKSSNTGAARIALHAGVHRQRAFLKRLGLLDPLVTQIGATADPLLPPAWKTINSVTISYGHGLSVTPLNFAAAISTLVNGGKHITPRFVDVTAGTRPPEQVLKPETSAAMRRMLQMVVDNGTGRRARIPGYAIGGKTGTAYKPGPGGYTDKVITSFFAAFPMEAPKYLLFVIMDEPKPTGGENTDSSHNAVPTAGNILKRVIPMLGIAPKPVAPHSPSYPKADRVAHGLAFDATRPTP